MLFSKRYDSEIAGGREIESEERREKKRGWKATLSGWVEPKHVFSLHHFFLLQFLYPAERSGIFFFFLFLPFLSLCFCCISLLPLVRFVYCIGTPKSKELENPALFFSFDSRPLIHVQLFAGFAVLRHWLLFVSASIE